MIENIGNGSSPVKPAALVKNLRASIISTYKRY